MKNRNFDVNKPATVRYVPEAHVYFSQRKKRTAIVTEGFTAIVCEACEYELNRPNRLGDHEDIGTQHLLTAHHSQIVLGTVVLSRTPKAWHQDMVTKLRQMVP